MSAREIRSVRSGLQMIFQDPGSSLNGRRKVRSIVAEGLSIHKAAKPWNVRVDEALVILNSMTTDSSASPSGQPASSASSLVNELFQPMSAIFCISAA